MSFNKKTENNELLNVLRVVLVCQEVFALAFYPLSEWLIKNRTQEN